MSLKSDLPWALFCIFWIVTAVFFRMTKFTFWFSPLLIMLLYSFGFIVAYFVGYTLKKNYEITKEPIKFFFGTGLQVISVFWLLVVVLAPNKFAQQTGLFLWSPHIGLIIATIIFIAGIIPRDEEQKNHLFEKSEKLNDAIMIFVFVFALFLTTSPWGVRGIKVFEEGSFPFGETLLGVFLTILIVLAFILEAHHNSFRGLNYNTLSRGTIFLTVAHYGLLVAQPWSGQWWIFNLASLTTIVIIGIKTWSELKINNNIQRSIHTWKQTTKSKLTK